MLFRSKVKGIDLAREGVSVIPIYGVHFDVYARLFSDTGLPKRCAIVTDGDLKPSDAVPGLEGEDELPPPPDLEALENDWVQVFACKTTFERALVFPGTLEMFAKSADEIGAPIVAGRLRAGLEAIKDGMADEDEKELLNALRASVLNTAKRFGKARFAQVTARYVDCAEVLPKYLGDALKWLVEE